MIIGLTGPNASGKGAVAELLQKQGYIFYSLSDIIREEAQEMEVEDTRENLQEIGNVLREKNGPDYLAKEINKKILENQKAGITNFVIDSIRNPSEVEELRKNKDFILLGVDAPIELRYERAKNRGRIEPLKTLEEFKKSEELENNTEPNKQQLTVVFKSADRLVYNDDTIEELKESLEYVLTHEKKKRPDWDTYFMQLCDLIKKRGQCLRREVGAVLVRNNQIISTGYNGTPKGHPHCDALGGCLRDKLKVPSGQRFEISRAVHAEENAIAQAAENGISTKGATLYCTTYPCVMCMRIITNAGIKKIIYKEYYADEITASIAKRSGVELAQYKGEKYV